MFTQVTNRKPALAEAQVLREAAVGKKLLVCLQIAKLFVKIAKYFLEQIYVFPWPLEG